MAKKPPQTEPEVKEPKPKETEVNAVTVKVVSAALGEGDVTYLKGETFATTTDRAAALGDSIVVV